MFKRVFIVALLVISLVGVFGCTSSDSSQTPASIKYIRESEIASTWQMKQLELTFKTEMSVTLELAAGDKVDGYYYVMTTSGVDFSISGISQIYASGKEASSDRFSFTASQTQGIDYKLKFTATGSDKEDTIVFLEIIYPKTGEVLVPIGTK
jgi:hypothetical protein